VVNLEGYAEQPQVFLQFAKMVSAIGAKLIDTAGGILRDVLARLLFTIE
jgi:hypothetical protein